MQYLKSLFLFTLFLTPLSTNAQAPLRTLQCKIVGISDGDTVKCLYNRVPLKVRLLYIDAPESSQPFGKKSKQLLSRLVFKKYVTLKTQGYDRYNRVLAVIYDNNLNVNLKMVEQGLAWAYRFNSQEIYRKAQRQAKSQKLGLWQDRYPIEPYEWRKSKKSSYHHFKKKTQTLSSNSNNTTVNCDYRMTCKRIANYEMAVKYFRQCAWGHRLDGNHDGIPCNKLYRKR